jgi:hypothetical protein
MKKLIWLLPPGIQDIARFESEFHSFFSSLFGELLETMLEEASPL